MAKDHIVKISIQTDLKTEKLPGQVNNIQKVLSNLKIPGAVLGKEINTAISTIEKDVDLLRKRVAEPFTSTADVANVEKAYNSIMKLLGSLQIKLNNVDTSKLELKGTEASRKNIERLEAQLEGLNTELTENQTKAKSLIKSLNGSIKPLKIDVELDSLLEATKEVGKAESMIDDLEKKAKAQLAAANGRAQAKAKRDAAISYLAQEDKKGGMIVGGPNGNSVKYKKAQETIAKSEAIINLADVGKGTKTLAEQKQKLEENIDVLKDLKILLHGMSASDAAAEIKKIQTELNNIKVTNGTEAVNDLNEVKTAVAGLFNELEKGTGPELAGLKKQAQDADLLNNQMGMLKQNMIQFFSLTNGWTILKNVVRNAYETIKELDEAMTEIAVVTTKTLDDVWATRMQYSKDATAMGAATIDMVNASKLYYQQGLKENEVRKASIETIQMARIANLDGAYATDLMTAAVRGFNKTMEDAGHINDVYSKLAAVSAADTKEIASAMTRTASIAHSANASFDNTAAFLTQMIETTREAPENIGTALKTIIARFQEMKKDPALTEPVEGEMVNVNKTEAALRSVGIALRDQAGEFRNFDDVILDISAKWDTMSMMQQRYIATTAAGSRQQSRFIALVQNNARLLKLTGDAANSAGSAQTQFSKTLDSLQSKLNKLNNALDLFWTNLFDNSVMKLAIDTMTGFMDIINGILGALPEFARGITGIAMTVATFVGASKIMNLGLTKTAEIFFSMAPGADNSAKAVKKHTLATIADSIATKKDTVAKGINAIVTKVLQTNIMQATVTVIGFQASLVLLFGAVLAVVAVVGLLVFGLYQLWKTAKNNSIEGRMKAAEKATEAAKKAAEQAQTAYDDLLSSFEKYDGATKALEDLTKGTDEWRTALINANNEAIKLMQLYPKLAEGMEIDKDGAITFSAESKKDLIDKQATAAKNAQAGIAGTRINELEVSKEVVKKGLDRTLTKDIESEQLYSKHNVTDFFTPEMAPAEVARLLADTEALKAAIEKKFSDTKVNGTSDLIATRLQEHKTDIAEYYRQIGEYSIEQEAQSKVYLSGLLSEESNNSPYKDAIVNSLLPDIERGDLLKKAKEYVDNTFDARAEAQKRGLGDFTWTKDAIKAVYADVSGYASVDDISKEEADDVDGMKALIGRVKISEDYKAAMEQLRVDIQNSSGIVQEAIAGSLNVNPDAIIREINENTPEALEAAMRQSVKHIREAQNGMTNRLSVLMSSGYGELVPNLSGLYEAFKLKNGSKDFNGLQTLQDKLLQIKNTLGDAALTTFNTKLLALSNDQNEAFDPAKVKEFTNTLNSINFESPIASYKGLLDMVKNGSEEAKQILKDSADYFSLGKQSQEVFSTLSDEDLKKIAEGGDNAGQAILDLAKSNGTLKTMLDATGTSASSLGMIFNKLEDGTLNMTDFTNGYVEALIKLNAVSANTQDVMNRIKDFKAPDSTTDIGAFYTEAKDKIAELYKRGAYGDPQLTAYMEQFVGVTKWNDTIKKYGGNIKKAIDELKPLLDSFNGSLYGMFKNKAGEEGVDDLYTIDAQGQVLFNLDNVTGTQDLINQIAEKTGLTKEMSSAMVADAVTYSETLLSALTALDAKEGLATLLNKAGSRETIGADGKPSTTKFVTEEQLSPFVAASGKTFDDFKKELKEKANIEIDVTPILKDGKLREDVIDPMKKRLKSAMVSEESPVNESGIKKALSQEYDNLITLGLDDTEAKAQIKNLLQTDFGGLQFYAADGSLQTLTTEVAGSWSDGIVSEEAQAAADLAAAKQAEALSNGVYVGVSMGLGSALTKFLEALATVKFNGFAVFEGIDTSGLQGLGAAAQGQVNGKQTAASLEAQLKQTNYDQARKDSAAALEKLKTDLGGIIPAGGKVAAYNNSGSRYSGGKGGGGGGGSKSEPWKNSYDWLYNLLQQTNAEIEKRNVLEYEYNNLLKNRKATTTDLYNNLKQERANLEAQQSLYSQQLAGRQTEASRVLSQYSNLSKYGTYNAQINTISINWDAINAVKDEKVGSQIEEYIGKLETISDQINEANGSLRETNTLLAELAIKGRDDYSTLNQSLFDALVEKRQLEIDKLTAINESITTGNQKLLDGIQKGIDEQRQAREQDKTLADLQAKERRLAMLQSDTSGVNAVEILALQKDIAEGRQGMSDTLVDNVINKMKENNDLAAEKGQEQISLLEQQLKQDQENGVIWSQVYDILTTSMGKSLKDSYAWEILSETKDYLNKSIVDKDIFADEMNKAFVSGLSYIRDKGAVTGAMDGQTISFINGSGEVIQGTVDSTGKVKGADGKVYSDVFQAPNGKYMTTDKGVAPAPPAPPAPAPAPAPTPTKPSASDIERMYSAINNGRAGSGWNNRLKYFRNSLKINITDAQFEIFKKIFNANYPNKSTLSKLKMAQYKKGGLADFTGPAWLDGTANSPELVLNAKDTENFIQLKDILSGLMNNMSSTTQPAPSGGDNYEIHIEVDSISSDYDVEQMAVKLQKMIVENSRYRNVNALGYIK